jgi:hypothetical protein
VIVELIGEGKTDIHEADTVDGPSGSGVLTRLVFALCEKPQNMRLKRKPIPHLQQGTSLTQKVKFAKRQAKIDGSDGVVFVMDTEGDQEGRLSELTDGRNAIHPDFPMAVGAAHPCIEVWLLADPAAMMKGMNLAQRPAPPADLEKLPAPRQDRKHNPKTILAACCGVKKADLSAKDKDQIAAQIRVLQRLRDGCPTSFGPFADEIEQRIRPLFQLPDDPASASSV